MTQELAGFRHYLTDAQVHLVNDFVRDHGNLDDHDPPVWTSTYNDHAGCRRWSRRRGSGFRRRTAPAAEDHRRWDVALDKNRVHYVLYAQPHAVRLRT